MEQDTPFSVVGALEATPHLYDYIHSVHFLPSSVVEMDDGAGQMLTARMKGRFSVEMKEQDVALIHFRDLVEFEGYDDNDEPVTTFPPVSIKVTREEGIFPFVQEVVWNIANEEEWPCLLYRVRYVFERDPLALVDEQREGNVYYVLEGAKEQDTRYYYCRDDREELTARELENMGIAVF